MIIPIWNYTARCYTTCKHGHGARIQANKRRDLRQEARIIELYRSGLDVRPMSRFLGLARHVIQKVLKLHRVPMRQMSDIKSIYRCNDRYFDDIDCEEKAYWLGFIAADGTVCTDFGKYLFAIELSTRDVDHVRKLKRALGSTHPLLFREQTLLATGRSHESVRLAIGCRKLVEGLTSHGIVPRKTYSLEFPSWMSNELLRCYCRGFIDGDGCFSMNQNGHVHFSVTGRREFLEDLQLFLMRECSLPKMPIHSRDITEAVYFTYTRAEHVHRVLEYLYDGATVYLDRKEKFFSMLPGTQLPLSLLRVE